MVKIMLRKHSDIIDRLTDRVKSYYNTINRRQMFSIYSIVDMELFSEFGGVGAWLQGNLPILDSFANVYGKIEVVNVAMDVHFDERSIKYNRRDYAIGKSDCNTAIGKTFFEEEWVLSNRGLWVNCNIVPKEFDKKEEA
jgi:hypothetical protein